MGFPLAPSDLLTLHIPFADHLVDRGFHEGCRDRLPRSMSITKFWNVDLFGPDVLVEFVHCLEQFLSALGMLCDQLQVTLQILLDLKRPIDVLMPQVQLHTFRVFPSLSNVFVVRSFLLFVAGRALAEFRVFLTNRSIVLLRNYSRAVTVSLCAQLCRTPPHSSLLEPKFGFRANLGEKGPE